VLPRLEDCRLLREMAGVLNAVPLPELEPCEELGDPLLEPPDEDGEDWRGATTCKVADANPPVGFDAVTT
jgi:hypothetical protein